MNSQNIHREDDGFSGEKRSLQSLDHLFGLFKSNPHVLHLRKSLSAIDGAAGGKGIPGTINNLKFIYEEAVKFVEGEAARSGFKKELLELQRNLYAELENILSLSGRDRRRHFMIVIPVADRPVMLKGCIGSLIEQCRIFRYGGFSIKEDGLPVYNKVSLFIIDDSKDETNINKTREIASETISAGINTYYVGLKEQAELLMQIPEDVRGWLSNLLGDSGSSLSSHKGASVTRNLAYLYLKAFLGELDDKTLIYFIDSDEEFRIKTTASGKIIEIPFINYFFWIDKVFESSSIEVLTGKVVGDPPVSPAVMINTFLDDVIFFFDSISGLKADDKCIFHETHSIGTFSAEYHDMGKLFGYSSPLAPREYYCSLTEAHTVKECFRDFSDKALDFFYGEHPTRTQFYIHIGDITKTENARTVYTGNYVINSEGLKHFIPFAKLKLRMAGPSLGRILKSSIKGKFVSANLPLLHKRTISGKNTDGFRSGILKNKDGIDLSGEFIKQFWGDVMLFSINELAESGYPVKEIDRMSITSVVDKTCGNLYKLYLEQQATTCEKILKLKNYLADLKSWWNTSSGLDRSLNNLRLFCSTVESNFGPASSVTKNLSEQTNDGLFAKKITTAIHSFREDKYYWQEALKTDFSLSSVCQKNHKPISPD